MFKMITRLDNRILSGIARLHTPRRDRFMVIITNLGNSGAIWLCFALPLLFVKDKRSIGLKTFVVVGISALVGEVFLKRLFKRLRPSEFILQEDILIRKPSSYSFPSGHATASFASAFVFSEYFQNLRILIFLLAAVISLSRLYVRVHYPTDVLAGVLLGFLCALAVSYVL